MKFCLGVRFNHNVPSILKQMKYNELELCSSVSKPRLDLQFTYNSKTKLICNRDQSIYVDHIHHAHLTTTFHRTPDKTTNAMTYNMNAQLNTC